MSVADAPPTPALPWWEVIRSWLVARGLWILALTAADAISGAHQFGPLDRIQLDAGLTIWDGDFYLRITEFGYGYTPRSALRFFPAYPAIGRLLSVDIGLPPAVVLPLISNLLALGAAALAWTFVMDRTGDQRLARRTVWLLAVFPSAGALILAYAEPLALVLGLASLVLLDRRRYGWASAAAVVAGATRPTAWLVSILIVVDLLVEKGVVPGNDVDRGGRGIAGGRAGAPVVPRLAVAAGPFVGTLAYLLWVGHRFGDWLEPVRIQSELRGGLQDPFSRFVELLKSLVTDPGNDAVNLAFVVVFVVAIVAGWSRLPRSWTALSIATVLVALSSQNIDSIGRYGLVAIPLIAGLAALAATDRANDATVFAFCAGGFVAIGVMTMIGGYIP